MKIRIGSTVSYEGEMYVVHNIEDKGGYDRSSYNMVYYLLPLTYIKEWGGQYIHDINLHKHIQCVDVKGSIMPLELIDAPLYVFAKPEVTVILRGGIDMNKDYEYNPQETLEAWNQYTSHEKK